MQISFCCFNNLAKATVLLTALSLISATANAAEINCTVERQDFIDIGEQTQVIHSKVGAMAVDITQREPAMLHAIDNPVEKAVVLCHGNICNPDAERLTCSLLNIHLAPGDKALAPTKITDSYRQQLCEGKTKSVNSAVNAMGMRLRPMQSSTAEPPTKRYYAQFLLNGASMLNVVCE